MSFIKPDIKPVLPSGHREYLPSGVGSISLRAQGVSPFGHREHLPPSGGNTALRAEGTLHSERRVHYTPNGGNTALRTEGTLHSERRVHCTPNGGQCSPIAPSLSGSFRISRRTADFHNIKFPAQNKFFFGRYRYKPVRSKFHHRSV